MSMTGKHVGTRRSSGSVGFALVRRLVPTSVVWRDPPADRRRLLTDEVLEQLRAHPGRWAVVREYANRTAVKGGIPVKHPPDIELRAVIEPPGSVLYARAKRRQP